MTRAATGDVVPVAPQANIYTVLVFAAFIVQLLALIVIFVRSRAVGVSFW